jgi:hypothetical protein
MDDRTWEVEVAVCVAGGTWASSTLRIGKWDLANPGDMRVGSGDLIEAARHKLLESKVEHVAVGLIGYQEAWAPWVEQWASEGDDMRCPECGAQEIETVNDITSCRACGWCMENPCAASNSAEHDAREAGQLP